MCTRREVPLVALPALLLTIIFTVDARGDTTYYVDASAVGAADGSSWCDAFVHLQDALIVASAGDTIRVAEGIYTSDRDAANPGGTGDRCATFQLINGVQILGGYAGCGAPDPDVRDFITCETTLTGDLNGDDGQDFALNDENSHHVVTATGSNATAILDGFTVTAGNADATTPDFGAGVYGGGGSATIRNCNITRNRADDGGGGLHDLDGDIVGCSVTFNAVVFGAGAAVKDCDGQITGCMIAHNTARSGAGLHNCLGTVSDSIISQNSADVTGGGLATCNGLIDRCTIIDNFAGNSGGGLYACGGSITNCTIQRNSAEIAGGGASDCNGAIAGCLISGNAAWIGGGLSYCDASLVNCTIVGNSGVGGGAIAYSEGAKANCIFWDNTDPFWYYSFPYPTYSCASVSLPGPGNIDVDPRFLDSGYWDGDQWVDGDYRLQRFSPTIDAGDNSSAAIAELSADLAGFLRLYDDPHTPDTGNGIPPIVDMGSYEYGDCNSNLVPDDEDIFGGASTDCNANGFPDECDPYEDCNGNGIFDPCDISGGASEDCNSNFVPDACDIASGMSLDNVPVGGDGVPDECQADCNGNGVLDDIDILTGFSDDCDTNEIPDECQWGLLTGTSFYLNSNAPYDTGADHDVQLSTDGQGTWLAIWSSDTNVGGTIRQDYDILVSRSADYGLSWSDPVAVNANASRDTGDDRHPAVATDGDGTYLVVWESRDSLDGALGTDTDILVSRSTDGGENWSDPIPVNANAADGSSEGDVDPQIGYDGADTWLVIWSSEEPLGAADGDWDIHYARSEDDGVTWTEQAVLHGTDLEATDDRHPALATDGEGIWLAMWHQDTWTGGSLGDDQDIVYSRSSDHGVTWSPPLPLDSNAAQDEGDDCDVVVATDGWGVWIAVWRSTDARDWTIGTDADLLFARSADGGSTWRNPLPLCAFAFDDDGQDLAPSIAVDGGGHWAIAWTSDNDLNGAIGPDADLLLAQSADGTTWDDPQPASHRALVDTGYDGYSHLVTDGHGSWFAAWMSEDDIAGTLGFDADILLASLPLSNEDCNNNNVLDHCELSDGSAEDCNLDSVPDDCSPFSDCNTNGSQDICDVAHGTSEDCNSNEVPDECEPAVDCNRNGVADICDAAGGASADCNRNGVPDECEPDCDGNNVADVCDLLGGAASDCNENCVPDVCDMEAHANADVDGNGILDECQRILRVPADFPAIQTALNLARDGDTVLVADGVYTGDDNNFLRMFGRAITLRSENGPEACTILCAEGGRGFSFHSGETSASVVDGFTITNASNVAGIWITSGSNPTIRNCVFTQNIDSGIVSDDSSPTFINCDVSYNGSDGWRAAMHFDGSGSPTVVGCRVRGNAVTGIHLNAGTVINTLVESNVGYAAGGISIGRTTDDSATIVNTVVRGNEGGAGGIGCGVGGGDGEASVINCTIVDNLGVQAGSVEVGGIFVASGWRVDVANTIVWGNTPDQWLSWGTFAVSFSDIQGGYAGVGNIAVDPRFVDSALGNLQVMPSSPCIDAGNNTIVPSDAMDLDADGETNERIPLDFEGSLRFADRPDTPDTGSGTPPLVDMGAYEHQDCNGNGTLDADDVASGRSPDCNWNSIPDECIEHEADCNGNLVPDECDIRGGQALDCNANGVPDQCDLSMATSGDCNANGIPDDCDIASGSSSDDDGNGVPDECGPGAPSAAPYPHERRKNRYISFDPNQAESADNVAFRIEVAGIAMGSCSGLESAPCRFTQGTGQNEPGDSDCGRCRDDGGPCISASIDCSPSSQTCDPSAEACTNDSPIVGGSNIGTVFWVGPEHPSGNDRFLAVSESFREERPGPDWPNVIHVGDCEIVPQATYAIRAVDVDTGTASDPLTVETQVRPASGVFAWWADCVGSLSGFCNGDYLQAACETSVNCGGDPCLLAWSLPNGATNFDDVNAVIQVFVASGGGLMTPNPAGPMATPELADITWVDIHGDNGGDASVDPPQGVANFSDISAMVAAFSGRPYPYSDPADCPDVGNWP